MRRKPPSKPRPFAAELAARSGFQADQLPRLAAGGDRESVRKCCGVLGAWFLNLETDLGEWFCVCLSSIREPVGSRPGMSPDEAFGWSQSRRGKPRALSSYWSQDMTWTGLVGAANGGHRATIRTCAAAAADELEQAARPPPGDLRRYGVSALRAIAAGTPPDVAFGWTVAGRRGRRRQSATIMRDKLAGDLLAAHAVENPGASRVDLAEAVSRKYRIGERSVRRAKR